VGCPAKHVTNGASGSALWVDPIHRDPAVEK
jgi:tRNA-dihydrouridine synthase